MSDKLFYEVYLPVAVTIDEDGELVGTPIIDWDGTPYQDTNNVWSNDPETAGFKVEEQAEDILRNLLDLGVDDVTTPKLDDQLVATRPSCRHVWVEDDTQQLVYCQEWGTRKPDHGSIADQQAGQ